MRDHDIRAKTARKFRCTTDSDHDLPVAENLLDRQFDPAAPNEAWVADITYIPTREGWLYLAAVEDLYSRRGGGGSGGAPPGGPPGGGAPGPGGARAAGRGRGGGGGGWGGGGWWGIGRGEASTPGTTTRPSWPATASPAAGAGGRTAGTTRRWRASSPR